MNKEQITIKLWKDTHRVAKIVAAYSGESMAELVHRLLVEEAERRGIYIDLLSKNGGEGK